MQLSDIEKLMKFARGFLTGSEMEIEFASWKASWREESLQHYLPLGWSFKICENEEMKGFFLAQPLLFMEGHTQLLWVEELLAATPEIEKALLETAYKLSREKHLQRVVFPDRENWREPFPTEKVKAFSTARFEVATVKT